MKHISILVPKEAHVGCVEGARQLFTTINQFMAAQGRPPVFEVQLIGLSEEQSLHKGLFIVWPHALLEDVKKTDLIIIPAVNGEMKDAVQANRELLPWIADQYKKGAEVASLCVGAFLLASTGLLDGKNCATHWMYANEFRSTFPDACLVDDKILTDEHGIYTSGGAFSYLNLLLYLVEKYAGREMAILASKVFAIEIDRTSQSSFIMFQGQREHADETIKKAQEFIEKNFQEKITVDQLADEFAVGRRSLERRFKKATCNTVTEYIQRVKIEAAKKGFETSRKNIYEIMFDVGYSDLKAFRSLFRKMTGLSPVEYRNRYNHEAVTTSI